MSAVDLLPCPFCGGTNITDEAYWIASPVEWFGKFKCNDCDTDGPLSEFKYDDRAEAVEDAKAAWNRRAPVSAGKVKALVWGGDFGDMADTPFGGYYVTENTDDLWRWSRSEYPYAHDSDSIYDTMEAAKAAAQADYEARILSQFEPGDGWQGIESAPKGQDVLLASPAGFRIDDWALYCRHNGPGFTHWMPLPAPPASLPQGEETR